MHHRLSFTALILGLLIGGSRVGLTDDEAIHVPAKDFVGGCHSTFYWQSDAEYGEGYAFKAARKVSIFSQGIEGSSIAAQFDLSQVPAREAALDITGLDDVHPGTTRIRICLNDETLHEGGTQFADNPHIYGPRGWVTQTFPVPAGTLRSGRNTLVIENIEDGRTDAIRWLFVHEAVLRCSGVDLKGSVLPGEDFLGRYFLEGKLEPVVYPAILKDNTVHLAEGRFLQQGFTCMANGEWNGKEVEVQVDMPATIEARVTDGDVVASESVTRDGTAYRRLRIKMTVATMAGRRIQYTGYPRIAMRAGNVSEDSPVYIRFRDGDTMHPERAYSVRVWPDHAGGRRPSEFFLGIWGSARPEDARVAEDLGVSMRDAGFGLVFGSNNGEEAAYFHKFGIKYYPRFGPQHPSKEFPSINWDGSENTRYADPIHLVYDAAAAKYPTFQRGIQAASQPWADGICCDYELLADSWSDRSIAEFKRFAPRYRDYSKQALRELATDPETGKYRPFPEWQEYRRWINARVVGRIQREIDKVRPGTPYLSLAAASDMPSLWWDARGRGRFRLRDLVNEVSEIACSVYHYDNPGGLPSIPAIVDTAVRFSKGHEVGVHLIGIFAGTIIELYRYGEVHLPGWAMRQDILLAACAGGRAFHFYSGAQLDGEYLAMASKAMDEYARLEPLIRDAETADDFVSAEFVTEPEYTLSRSSNHTFGQKLLWAGGAEHQTHQMLRRRADGSMVVLLFNFMNVPAEQRITVAHIEAGESFEVERVLGSADDGPTTVSPAEGFEWTVPARDVVALLLTPQ